MIQHLLSFTSEKEAATALAEYKLVTVDKAGVASWSGNVCLNHSGARPTASRVVLEKAQYVPSTKPNAKPEDRELSKAEVLQVGWQCIVALPKLDDGLRKLPGNALRVAWDGGTGAIVYQAADVTPAFLATAKVEPVFLGSKSPFGG